MGEEEEEEILHPLQKGERGGIYPHQEMIHCIVSHQKTKEKVRSLFGKLRIKVLAIFGVSL